MLYETEIMNFHRAQEFDIWFRENIGTEIECSLINNDINKIYFFCADLDAEDVDLLAAWENKEKKENG